MRYNYADLTHTGTVHSVYDLENVLLDLREIEEKVEFYEGLKKHRVESINVEIEKLESRSSDIRKIVLQSMKDLAPEKTTLNFPSIGKITRRKGKEDWIISKEEEMIDFLDKEGLKKECVEVKEVVSTTKAKKILNNLHEQNVHVPGTAKILKEETVSITFSDETPDTSTVQKPVLKIASGISEEDI